MVERMATSTSSANNVYGVEIDNNNSYRTMVMDTMRMNQDHVSQCPVIDELNVDATRFFDLLKDSNELL